MFSRPWASGVREMDCLRLGVSSAMCQTFQLKEKQREDPELKEAT
jgi:hypothetical protein